MKLDDLPDFAKPYKTKGFDVRFVRGAYQLFKITSKKVDGKNYPVLMQEYIGTIDKDKGLVNKKVFLDETLYLEYGLSHYLYHRFGRMILRSINGATKSKDDILIRIVICSYVMGSCSDNALKLCYLTYKYFDEIKECLKENLSTRINNLVNKIHLELSITFGNDLSDFELMMKMVVIPSNSNKIKVFYSPELRQICSNHKVKLYE